MPGTPGTPALVLNGKEFRWADIEVGLLGVKLKGRVEITYNGEQDDDFLYAEGDTPIDIISGNKKGEGNLGILKSTFDALEDAAILAGYNDVMSFQFPLSVSYSNDTRIRKIILLGCKINKWDDGMKQGDKFKTVNLPFKYISRKIVS